MRWLFYLVLLLAWSNSSLAQLPEEQCKAQAARGDISRVALVVGNNTTRAKKLLNGVSDARLIAETFQTLKFETVFVSELDSAKLRREIDNFKTRVSRLCPHDIVAFYYAGNGFELGRISYIATTNVSYPSVPESEMETLRPWVRVTEVLDAIRGHAGPKLVFIDTCRNYELSGSRASQMPEFSGALDIPRNTLMAYAAEPGQYASDGPPGSSNGPYAIALAKALLTPDVALEEALRLVREEVDQATKGTSVPFMESGLRDRLVLTATSRSVSQTRGAAASRSVTSSASSNRRVALVFGNSKYVHVKTLKNPANDAEDVAAALKRIGFEVKMILDATRQQMSDALTDFDESMSGDTKPDWALVYFAGHGIARDESPYMVSVDARLKSHTVIDQQTIKALPIFGMVAKAARLGLVILDACRENPFLQEVREDARKRSIVMGQGLPAVELADENVLVAYSTKHGQLADDGSVSDRNSPFVEVLLATIEEPGLDVEMLFRRVRDGVRRKTKNSQTPFTYASLPGVPVYLVDPR